MEPTPPRQRCPCSTTVTLSPPSQPSPYRSCSSARWSMVPTLLYTRVLDNSSASVKIQASLWLSPCAHSRVRGVLKDSGERCGASLPPWHPPFWGLPGPQCPAAPRSLWAGVGGAGTTSRCPWSLPAPWGPAGSLQVVSHQKSPRIPQNASLTASSLCCTTDQCSSAQLVPPNGWGFPLCSPVCFCASRFIRKDFPVR